MKLSMPKLQERDQALILIALGLLGAVAVYLLVYQRFTEETQALESTNATMQQQISLLQQLTDNRAKYEEDTENYIVDADEILQTFPVDLYEEDLILYAKHLDDMEDETYIPSISTPRRGVVGITVPTREDQLISESDITGQIQANAYVNDGSVLDVEQATLYSSATSMVVNTSYNGFKNLVIDAIGWEMEGQRRIGNITMTYDVETGGVMATMDLEHFAMSGFDRVYEVPDPEEEIDFGTNNFFGNGLPYGTLLPPLSDMDPNYIPPEEFPVFPGEGEEGLEDAENPDTFGAGTGPEGTGMDALRDENGMVSQNGAASESASGAEAGASTP